MSCKARSAALNIWKPLVLELITYHVALEDKLRVDFGVVVLATNNYQPIIRNIEDPKKGQPNIEPLLLDILQI